MTIKKFFKNLLFFLIYECIFCMMFSLFLIIKGPFENVREVYVCSAMATYRHQYLATMFFPKDVINSILEKAKKSQCSSLKVDTEKCDSNFNIDGVKLIDIKTSKFNGYLLEIKDPSRVHIATSGKLGEKGDTLSNMVMNDYAVGGINAGGFSDNSWTGNGGTPTGFIIENHKFRYQGDDTECPVIGFDDKDKLILAYMDYKEMEISHIRDAVSFYPFLIVDGEKKITEGDGGWGIAPRTAIGQREDGTVLMLTVDGRRAESFGATLKDCQDILYDYGAVNAANLDGGSSTTMNLGNKTVNKPSDILGERAIPSAFVIGGNR